jgi:hypothetical protein
MGLIIGLQSSTPYHLTALEVDTDIAFVLPVTRPYSTTAFVSSIVSRTSQHLRHGAQRVITCILILAKPLDLHHRCG